MEVEEEVPRSVVGKKEKKLAAQWSKELTGAMEDEENMERCGGDDRRGKGKGKGKGKQAQGGIDEGAMLGNEDYEESEEKYLLKFQEYLERNPEHVFRFATHHTHDTHDTH
jgi:hypothetical protein